MAATSKTRPTRERRRVDRPATTPTLPGTEHLGQPERGQYATWVDLVQVLPNPDNPRTGPGAGEIDRQMVGDNIAELAASIRAQGLLEPLVVAPRPAEALSVSGREEFVLIAGHRRRLALQQLTTTLDEDDRPVHDGRVLVIVRPDLADPGASTAAALVENLQRVDLTPLQEARAFLALRDVHGWSQGQIARAIGRNPGHVSKRLTLLDAVPLLTELIEAGTVPLDVAGDLARLPTDLQQQAARDISRRVATPTQARSTALADHENASARTRALRSLDVAGLAYEELGPGVRPPAASPAGPLRVDFPGYPHVLTAHDVPAGLPAPDCERRYVSRSRRHDVVSDPGANTYAGFDPAFVTGRYCLDPAQHAPTNPDPGLARDGDGASDVAASAPVSARTRLFSEGSGYVPYAGPATSSPSDTSTGQEGSPGDRSTQRAERDLLATTMARTGFLHRLLTDRIPPHAASVIAAHTLLSAALAPELTGIGADPGAEQGAVRLAVQLLGPGHAPTDASSTSHRRALLATIRGTQASTERRTRFALALTLARAEAHVLTATRAHALYPLNPTAHPGFDAITHLHAAETLATLNAWGHHLSPIEQAITDSAPTTAAALAAIPLTPDTPALADVVTDVVTEATQEVPEQDPGVDAGQEPDQEPANMPADIPAPTQTATALAETAPLPAQMTRPGRVRLPSVGEASRLAKPELMRLLGKAGLDTVLLAGSTAAQLREVLEHVRTRQEAHA